MASKKKSKKSIKAKPASKKKAASRKRAPKKKTAKKLTAGRRPSSSRKKTSASRRAARKPSRTRRAAPGDQEPVSPRTGAQSGDLQGLSDVETADSESVDELLEEGNALEADAVAGVEHADDEEEREVHTHEISEDDVPDEYRNQD